MIVELLVDGLIAVAALTGGYRFGSRGRRKGVGPEPICGCGHHLSQHSLDSGQCRHQSGQYDRAGRFVDRQDRHCTCQQYVGPKPAEMVIAGGEQFARADIAILRKEREKP